MLGFWILDMSYRKLEVWQLARTLTIDLHQMTVTKLPKFELYEEGSQIVFLQSVANSHLSEK